MAVLATAYGPPAGGLTVEDTVRALAASKLGVVPDQLLFAYHNFAARGATGVAVSTAGGGTQSYVSKALRLSTAAAGGASASVDMAAAIGGTRSQFILNGATDKWWIGSYMAVATAVGAAAIVGSGAASGVGAVELMTGGYGPSSQVNFVGFGSTGAVIDSGVPLDTTKRMHQMWRDGVTSYYQIDALSPVSGTARPTSNAGLYAATFDSAAVLRNLDLVWYACATTKP